MPHAPAPQDDQAKQTDAKAGVARDAAPVSPRASERRRLVAALACTQIIGWGTTYFLPAVIGRAIQDSLGISAETSFAGVTAMLLVAAAISAPTGRYLDRRGARVPLVAGSVLIGAGLVLLGLARGPAAYFAAWVLFGLSMPLALSNAAYAAIVQASGEGGRRAVATLMFFSGMSSAMFWPITGFLDSLLGWRMVCWAYAAANLLVCLPLHFWLVPRHRPPPLAPSRAAPTRVAPAAPPPSPAAEAGPLAPRTHRAVMLPLAAMLTTHAFLSWGLSLHFIPLFQDRGLAPATAIALASLVGTAQVAARAVEMLFLTGTTPLRLGLAALWALPGGFAILVAGGGTVASTLAFVLIYGACNGIITVARATVPLFLFGREGYAARMGVLTVPQNIAAAFSPLVFAAIAARAAPVVALGFGLVVALAALAAGILLARRVLQARAASA
ncbi:MAG: MFS transporter [Alphaproteobacteria bacterium]|nr:MFS transporter [Alphaproteobacteria bacterium]